MAEYGPPDEEELFPDEEAVVREIVGLRTARSNEHIRFRSDRENDIPDETRSASEWFTRNNAGSISDFVDKWYVMNPQIEDLLFDGSLLSEGMLVLIESPIRKVEITDRMTAEDFYNARKWNRWFVISNIKLEGSLGITFQATYDDGTKLKFIDDVVLEEAWFVRLRNPIWQNPGPKIGVAKVMLTNDGLNIDTDFSEPMTDTTVQEEVVESREGRPNLKMVSGSVFEQTQARWRQEERQAPWE